MKFEVLSATTEDARLVGCDAVSSGEQFPKFIRFPVPEISG